MDKNSIKIGIVGSGRIASDTATLFIGNGYNTVVLSRNDEGSSKALKSIQFNFEQLKNEGLIADEQVRRCFEYISFAVDYDMLKDCNFIFEAVFEKIDIKSIVFQALEKVCSPEAVFISTTSGISADDLAEAINKKDRLIVGHPWNPPHLIPLVEVVKSVHTSDETLNRTVELLESVGREIVVLKKNIEGFIGNRIQHAMFREAIHLIESGVADPEDIDKTIFYSFGQRYSTVGLMEYYDSVGLDLEYNVESYLFKSLCSATTAQEFLVERCKRGDLGPKTGRGVYDWSNKDYSEFSDRKSKPFYKFFNWDVPKE